MASEPQNVIRIRVYPTSIITQAIKVCIVPAILQTVYADAFLYCSGLLFKQIPLKYIFKVLLNSRQTLVEEATVSINDDLDP